MSDSATNENLREGRGERGDFGKDQGVGMKKGWQTTQLSAVAAVQSGAGFPDRYQGQSDGEIPFYKVSDMNIAGNEREMVFENNSITEEARRELGAFLFPQGSTIFPKIGGAIATNKKRLTTRDCCVDNNVMGVIPKLGKINSELLFYFFLAHDLSEFANEAHLPSIRKTVVEDWPIILPVSLAEQQRIVGLLDEAFEGLATAKTNAEKNLQNARALFESHLQSVFTQRGPGWVETTLESCCEQIFAGGDVPKDRLSEERTPKFSVPIYSNGEKNDGLYGFTDVARVTKPSITVSARGTLGFTAIRTEPFLPVVRLIVLVPDERQIMLSFLYYAVVGMDFGNTGTSIPQLTVPNFKESKLHVPTLSEQEAIVEKLDALTEETQRLARLYERKHVALEALKKSLLHQAFTGAL